MSKKNSNLIKKRKRNRNFEKQNGVSVGFLKRSKKFWRDLFVTVLNFLVSLNLFESLAQVIITSSKLIGVSKYDALALIFKSKKLFLKKILSFQSIFFDFTLYHIQFS